MRPQPVRLIRGAPPFVSGAAVIRGESVPVVDARRMIGESFASPPGRFVTLKVANRRVALGVDTVVSVETLDRSRTADLPPLLAHASDEVVSALIVRDDELFIVLQAGKLVADSAWAAIERGAEE
jgi:purine-binding chemotaxis protein CheW